jgi:hypothetical protein
MPRVSVEEAAKRLNASGQFVRIAMQQGKLPIGVAIQMSKRRWTYHISEKLLEEYIGKEGVYDRQQV